MNEYSHFFSKSTFGDSSEARAELGWKRSYTFSSR